jgi:putative phage-type endonuclease
MPARAREGGSAQGSDRGGSVTDVVAPGTEFVTDYGTREAWLVARRSGVGASESAALFGLSPFSSRLSLWMEKTGRVSGWEPEGEQAERLYWGSKLEAPIAETHAERTGRKLWAFSPFSIARHPRIACALATPDRYIIEAPDRRAKGLPEEGNLEIKNTANVWGADSWGEGVPMYVQCQVQHQLWVTGRAYATVATLAMGNRLLTWDIERNESFIAELEIRVLEFWDSVVNDVQPPAEAHPKTLEALKRLHPLDNHKSIALPPEAVEVWDRLLKARAALNEAVKIEQACDIRMRELFGPYTYGLMPDGRKLSFKTTTIAQRTQVVNGYTYRTMRETKDMVPRPEIEGAPPPPEPSPPPPDDITTARKAKKKARKAA